VPCADLLLEYYIGEQDPPPITHPEFFYGFVGVAVAWQMLFLLMSRDSACLPAVDPGGRSREADLWRGSFSPVISRTAFGGFDADGRVR